jgi:hypothetical protein
MKNNKILPYVIAFSAAAVAICSTYLYFTGKQDKVMALLTIVSCTLVAMGQYFIIKSKK